MSGCSLEVSEEKPLHERVGETHESRSFYQIEAKLDHDVVFTTEDFRNFAGDPSGKTEISTSSQAPGRLSQASSVEGGREEELTSS